MSSSSPKPQRDTRLIELCSVSRRLIAEMADRIRVGCEDDHYDESEATHKWCEAVEIISRTRALTYAGIKAKTRVCYDVITRLGTYNGTETYLMRSLFRDILGV